MSSYEDVVALVRETPGQTSHFYAVKLDIADVFGAKSSVSRALSYAKRIGLLRSEVDGSEVDGSDAYAPNHFLWFPVDNPPTPALRQRGRR